MLRFYLVLVILPLSVHAQWKQIAGKDGIKVFSQAASGSNFYKFRGVGVIHAKASKVFTIVQDIKKLSQWVEGSKNIRLINKNFNAKSYNMKINEFYQIFYGQNSTPWPFEDRDYILKGNVTYKPKEKAAYIKLKNISLKSVPQIKGITRMKVMRVEFKIKPLGNGDSCLVRFTVQVNPGGYIPVWAVNFMAKNEPVKTIRKLRKLARKDNYDKEIEKLVIFHLKKLQVK